MGQRDIKAASKSHVVEDDVSLVRDAAGSSERLSVEQPIFASARERFYEEGSEPSYSQVVANSRASSRPSVRPSLRPSFRPSAFGPPRTSVRPPAPEEESLQGLGSALERELAEGNLAQPALPDIDGPLARSRAHFDEVLEPRHEEPTPTGPRRRVRSPEQGTSLAVAIASSQSPATFRADLEDLLPFVSAKNSVPPTLPALPEKPAARPQDPKRNRISVAIFGAMLLASIVPLARYARSGAASSLESQAAASRVTSAVEPSALELPAEVLAPRPPAALPEKLPADPMLEALSQAESDLPADPAAAADQLMNLGLKALGAGDERFAEALLGRALKRDDDNPRAYFALARIRMSQGNLQGAEGWVVSALHKRPRRAEYHALYATVLEALGRSEEAAKARARADELR